MFAEASWACVSCRRACIRRRMSFMRLLYAPRTTVARTRDGMVLRSGWIPRVLWSSRYCCVYLLKDGAPAM